ncbi:type II toxin-antitoxin system RelE/ParE family toxin [Bdellovibrionota bacterium FG-2]
MKIVWTDEAREKLFEIQDYIVNQGSPANAEQFIQRLIERTKILADFPTSGRIVPEYASEDLRELVEAGYRIVYRIKKNLIEIETVYEPRRIFSKADHSPSKSRR